MKQVIFILIVALAAASCSPKLSVADNGPVPKKYINWNHRH